MEHNWLHSPFGIAICDTCQVVRALDIKARPVYITTDMKIHIDEPECCTEDVSNPALYNVQMKPTRLIKIAGHIIPETMISGIGPLLRKERLSSGEAGLFFSLYLVSYKIEVNTDMLLHFAEEAKKIYKEFSQDYKALCTAFQAHDWDIYHSYMQEKEKTKNP